MRIIGWDIGGAHIKAVKIDFIKKKSKTIRVYSPLWKNINNLKKSIKLIKKKLGKTDYHGLVMTAELSDIFKNRKIGAKYIVKLTSSILGKKKTFFYNKKNFLKKEYALKKASCLKSLNWHATARHISNSFSNCILIDIGSTTTDIIPIKNKKVIAKGKNDRQRLKSNELVYLGVLRSPIYAIEKKKNLIPENFADTADIYRVLKKIPKKYDLLPTKDKKSKNKHASARRIARVFGEDYKKNNFKKWKDISYQIKKKHLKILKEKINKIRKKNFSKKIPIVSAGIGDFLLKKINKKKIFSFYSKTKFIKKTDSVNCEAAISTAILLKSFLERK